MRTCACNHRVGARPGWIWLGILAVVVGVGLAWLNGPTEPQRSLAADRFLRPAETPFAATVWPASAEMSTVAFAAGAGEAYRFVWMRTFARPVVVRVEIASDRRARLILKVFDGGGGYPWGPLVVHRVVSLGPAEIRRLRLGFYVNRFRGLHPYPPRTGLDGSAWWVESRHQGRYRWVLRWTPKSGPVRRLGLMMLDLAGHRPEGRVY